MLADGAVVFGFYTLSATVIGLRDLQQSVVKALPRYPQVPATLMGRLAVDERRRGRRFGEILLMDALHRSYEASRQVASVAVVVDAKDAEIQGFYKKYDFDVLHEATSTAPARLYLLMDTIAKLF